MHKLCAFLFLFELDLSWQGDEWSDGKSGQNDGISSRTTDEKEGDGKTGQNDG